MNRKDRHTKPVEITLPLCQTIKKIQGLFFSKDGVRLTINEVIDRALKLLRRQVEEEVRIGDGPDPRLFNINWSTNRHGQRIFLDQLFLDMTGMSMADASGGKFFDAVHPDDRERVRREFDEALVHQTAIGCTFRLRLVNGGYVLMRSHGTPCYHPITHEFLGYVGSMLEIQSSKPMLLGSNGFPAQPAVTRVSSNRT